MRLTVIGVGRLKSGPEATLVSDYLSRIDAAGRPQALGPARVVEIDERKARARDAQAEALLAASQGMHKVALDEHGQAPTSPELAQALGALRDRGIGEVAFLIGGADGHGEAVLRAADLRLSLGPMVWPHMLVRVMLAEQLYRAVSILAGSPYHRP